MDNDLTVIKDSTLIDIKTNVGFPAFLLVKKQERNMYNEARSWPPLTESYGGTS